MNDYKKLVIQSHDRVIDSLTDWLILYGCPFLNGVCMREGCFGVPLYSDAFTCDCCDRQICQGERWESIEVSDNGVSQEKVVCYACYLRWERARYVSREEWL